jgi:hypothetical protein
MSSPSVLTGTFADVDNDTLAAIQGVWSLPTNTLPAIVPQSPKVLRLKEDLVPQGFGDGKTGYVGAECILNHRQMAGTDGSFFDVRKVTLRGWGIKSLAQQIGQGLWFLFNRNTVLNYPSTDPTTHLPRFHKWWPEGGVDLKEDIDTKVAKDIWYAELVALVWSIRNA